MINISEQIKYWKTGAQEDRDVADQLITNGKFRHGLFFAHLALEKLLKAHVCHKTQKIAPKTHNLVRLAVLAGLELEDRQVEILAEMIEFNIEGRYPLNNIATLQKEETDTYMERSKEVYQWLIRQL